MSDLFLALVIVADVLAIGDILRRLRGATARILWIVAVVALPLLGAAYWVYVQYSAPAARKSRRSG